jgi:hypothetical protein
LKTNLNLRKVCLLNPNQKNAHRSRWGAGQNHGRNSLDLDSVQSTAKCREFQQISLEKAPEKAETRVTEGAYDS